MMRLRCDHRLTMYLLCSSVWPAQIQFPMELSPSQNHIGSQPSFCILVSISLNVLFTLLVFHSPRDHNHVIGYISVKTLTLLIAHRPGRIYTPWPWHSSPFTLPCSPLTCDTSDCEGVAEVSQNSDYIMWVVSNTDSHSITAFHKFIKINYNFKEKVFQRFGHKITIIRNAFMKWANWLGHRMGLKMDSAVRSVYYVLSNLLKHKTM